MSAPIFNRTTKVALLKSLDIQSGFIKNTQRTISEEPKTISKFIYPMYQIRLTISSEGPLLQLRFSSSRQPGNNLIQIRIVYIPSSSCIQYPHQGRLSRPSSAASTASFFHRLFQSSLLTTTRILMPLVTMNLL